MVIALDSLRRVESQKDVDIPNSAFDDNLERAKILEAPGHDRHRTMLSRTKVKFQPVSKAA